VRVCFISHSSQDGGAERVLLEALDVLREAKVECLVVVPAPGELVGEIEARGAACRIVPMRRWVTQATGGFRRWLLPAAKVGSHLLAARRIAAIVARERCDLVVTNTIAVVCGALGAALARRPHVWWIHEFGPEDHGLHFEWGPVPSVRLIGRMSALVLVNSRAVMAKFASLLGDREPRLLFYGVHAGFDRDSRAGRAPAPAAAGDHAPRICVVGRIEPGKAQEVAVRAVGRLSDRGVDVVLHLIGRGRDTLYGDHVHALACRLGVEDRVLFVGHVAEPLPAISACDAVVVCSRSEAFGRVAVEAMKLGVPVVGARSGGTAELIDDGTTGLLYAPGDDAELADKLAMLLADPALRRSLAERGQRWASENFSRERFGRELLAQLRSVLPDQPAAAPGATPSRT
jgi:glycosyltransferase involved in cell wall biosynthesis